MHNAIFRLETAAKAAGKIPDGAIALEQLAGTRICQVVVAMDFALAGRGLGHEGLRRFQNRLPFLFQLLLARHYHLIVNRFPDAVLDKMFTHVLFVFHSRRAMGG